MAEISVIDSLEHDSLYGGYNSLVMIDSTHFIVAYKGDGSDGFIKTFSIDGSYDNITEIDSLEHDTDYASSNSLVMIDSTHFMLAYKSTGNAVRAKTFSIDGSYDNITEIDNFQVDVSYQESNSLLKIDSTHFILAYKGASNDGFIKTLSIDGSYDNITIIDSLEHDTANGGHNSFVMIDSTHFILAYSSTGDVGYIKTFSIDGSYDNITQIDSLQHEAVDAVNNHFVMIDSTHFMLAYQGVDSNGFIKTFSIDGSYDNITEIDSLEYLDSYSVPNSLIKIDSSNYILSSANGDRFYLFSIDGSYEITKLDITNSFLYGGDLVMIDSTHLIMAYNGADADGFMSTFLLTVTDGNIDSIDGVDWGDIDSIDGVDVDDVDYIDGIEV